MPKLFLIRGLPGSGKTFLGRMMVASEASIAGPFAADDFFTDYNGNYVYNSQRIGAAHAYCAKRTENAMKEFGKPDVVVTNTFSRKWEMQKYKEMAELHKYECVVISIATDASNEELAARNVHNVPEEVIAKMRNRWEN